jgi:hypothetical protein
MCVNHYFQKSKQTITSDLFRIRERAILIRPRCRPAPGPFDTVGRPYPRVDPWFFLLTRDETQAERQWEREHREQRNARRRALRLTAQALPSPKAVPQPALNQKSTSGWKVIAGLAVGVGIALVAAVAGASLFTLGGSDAIGP